MTADVRLLESMALRIDESSLTGESVPVEKRADIVLAGDVPPADRVNVAFNGTSVTGGLGHGVVVATGQATEIGRIAALAASARETRTPLQRQLGELARWLVWVALGLSALVPTLGVLVAGQPVREMLLSGLTLAFATIPEELPILVTVVLGLGACRLAQERAITRRLEAAEALGSVTVVATDKTGTVTENRMRVAEVFVDGTAEPSGDRRPNVRRLLEIGMLANEAHASDRGNRAGFAGDPTDVALLTAARDAGIATDATTLGIQVLTRIPFDDTRRRMSTVYQRDGARVLATKGAPEILLNLSTSLRTHEGVRQLDDAVRTATLAQASDMAARGLRVLAFAERELPAREDVGAIDGDKALQERQFRRLAGAQRATPRRCVPFLRCVINPLGHLKIVADSGNGYHARRNHKRDREDQAQKKLRTTNLVLKLGAL